MAVAVGVVVSAWWLCWPDSDLTREFRQWAEEQPLGERGQEEGVRELTVDRSGGVLSYRLEYGGNPARADLKCNSVAIFAMVRGDDSKQIVVRVHDPAGKLLAQKDVGAEWCPIG
ncbi:hypothetical protein FKR81_05585 [Lentzea tibetensis]|uniref:Uncharacterized protein n=1 Tax=Lentzea tibetensis TaxID=2591470 RepID=A0A563F0X6_9PSEU|nr:hypothetical protein FKR81_05585 [Lentzea tibetensis]